MGKRSVLGNSEYTKFLVIGGRSPIALAIANRLVDEGEVVLCTRKIDAEIQKIISQDVVLFESDITKLFDSKVITSPTLKDINCVIFVHRYRGDPEDLEAAFQCEVFGPLNLIQKIRDSDNSGALRTVLFFTSPAAERIVGDQPLSYHLTKAAVSQLIKFLSVKYAKDRISVVGVSPGSFVMKARSEEFYKKNRALKIGIESKIPSGTFITPEEIAELVSFAATSKQLSLSGNILNLDHGLGLLENSTFIREIFQ
jgi:NAD(P)-dependent dehydrogenase (short-subunit alcohol dehydrogenase family)